MAKANFTVTLNVKDIKTGIEFTKVVRLLGDHRRPTIVGLNAIKKYKNEVFVEWCERVRENFGLTAKQLNDMIEYDIIVPPDLFEVKVAEIKGELLEHLSL